MAADFCQVLVSAATEDEAEKISNALVQNRLVAGTLITKGKSNYWWQGEIVKKDYYNISAFSLVKNKSEIIAEVKKFHSNDCPIIAFLKLDGNNEFLKWIKNTIKS